MMTKRDYCLQICQHFLESYEDNNENNKHGMTFEELENSLEGLFAHVYQSSSLAVALSYLFKDNKKIQEKYKDKFRYASTRGGVVEIFSIKDKDDAYISILSVRELLDLLPESID